MEQGQYHPLRYVVVDLDGTLIDGNSLKEYILTALRTSGAVRNRFAVLSWLALRKLRIISHKRMKFAVLAHISANQALKTTFVRRLNSLLKPSVQRIINDYKVNGRKIVLATAAPDVYIPWIWSGEYVATLTDNNPHKIECRGELKLQAVQKLIGENGIIEVVITDHRDDLPLLAVGSTNFLVSPDSSTITTVDMTGIKYSIIDDK